MRDKNHKQAQPKRSHEKGFTKIVRDARAEGVGQRGEEEVEGTEEGHENWRVSDWRLEIRDWRLEIQD